MCKVHVCSGRLSCCRQGPEGHDYSGRYDNNPLKIRLPRCTADRMRNTITQTLAPLLFLHHFTEHVEHDDRSVWRAGDYFTRGRRGVYFLSTYGLPFPRIFNGRESGNVAQNQYNKTRADKTVRLILYFSISETRQLSGRPVCSHRACNRIYIYRTSVRLHAQHAPCRFSSTRI